MDGSSTERNNKDMKMKWYELARSRMKELGITQEKLAEELGMTQGGIGHWLRGSRHPSLSDIGVVFKYLGIDNISFNHDGTFSPVGEYSSAPVKKQYEYPVFSCSGWDVLSRTQNLYQRRCGEIGKHNQKSQ